MPLRVVHVIDSLAASGGAENRLVDEVLALDGRFDQTVVRLFESHDLDARLLGAGIPVVPLGFSGRWAARTWPLMAARLRRELRQRRPDVVHTSLATGNLVGQLAAASLDLPVVSTFNRTGDVQLLDGVQQSSRFVGWKVRSMRSVGRWATRRSNAHYRAVGSAARDTNCASMGLGIDRATVVPRGIQIAADDALGDRARFGVPDDVPLFVNVARRVPEKAQHLLVAAFALVRNELPEARLLIAGAPGPADETVRAAIAKARLEDAVDLLGFRSDVRILLASADVFAFSSLAEGSPGAVVEALALGAAVAAFDIPPVAELTDGARHAWLAPAGSVPDLAEAMLAACQAPDRLDRAAAAKRCAERYHLSVVSRQLGDLLEASVGARRPRHEVTAR